MDKPIEHYWDIRLRDLKEALEENNFEVYLAKDGRGAKEIVLKDILPKTKAKSVSWGGSVTFRTLGLYEAMVERSDLRVVDTYDHSLPREEIMEKRRESLLVDLYITGSNAVTEDGQIVNLDMYGNRVAAITFGPKDVVILLGRNKVVSDIDEAMHRIKNYAAPTNAMRLEKKTPCTKTSFCEECRSEGRICNTWTITEKSFPKGRIKVILINQDLGL
ncbi:MAG: lactate utilization protein [Deltaproteobacteria bacterium]|nr:lactate utilization protein [Deltaproteobacteria bacterium]MBW2137379.1 lactate utilization protein [Deltaproteobacteria bacterium]